MKQPDDPVNHPPHYTGHKSGVECITICEHHNFCIGNAIKYRASNRPCAVTIGGTSNGATAHLWVRDNGIGVPEDQFERIFGLFQRLHTRDQIEGSGLGLAIVQRIVDRHGGRVWVESTLGEGSTFHVELPVPGAG